MGSMRWHRVRRARRAPRPRCRNEPPRRPPRTLTPPRNGAGTTAAAAGEDAGAGEAGIAPPGMVRRSANGRPRTEGARFAGREERPESGLTLARAFQLMGQALSEFRSPVGQEALRL